MRVFWEKYGVKLLLVATLTAVSLSVLSYVGSSSSFLHNTLGVLTAPFKSASSAIVAWVQDKQYYYKDHSDLAEENAQLRARVAELEQQARQAQADSEENALLRQLLDLRERKRDLQFASASIIERQNSNWASSLTLDRGSEHGIEAGQCVISSEGYLVGIITEVGLNWSTVQTTIDTDTQIGARVFRTGEIGVAEGDLSLMGEGCLKLSYLFADTDIMHGDYIVTSGLGGFFPSDLGIGTVTSIKTDDDGITQYAVLSPMAALDTLSEVFIITAHDITD